MAAHSAAIFYSMKPRKFSFDLCSTEAAKYDSRRAFFDGARWAYAALSKRGMLDAACAHMQISPLYSYARWTEESALAEAAKYKNRAEFKRNNQGAYGYALKNNLLPVAFSHMRDCHNFWHIFELMAVSLKYADKGIFIKAERQAYNFANKNKLVDMACAHMSKLRVDWDKESVMAAAAKHSSRGIFQAALAGAYKHADKHGYLDEACAHMPEPEYGFSKEKQAVLYHLKIVLADGTALYKIGITNRTPEARIAGMGVKPGATVEILDVITFESGRDARIAEKRLHRRMAKHRYTGLPVMKNGNTELFTVGALN